MPNFLNKDQILVLKQAHRTIRDKKLADRIKAVLMLHWEFTPAQISQALMLDEATLRRYVRLFQNKGITGLLEYRYTGGQSKLTTIQEQELKVFLKINTYRTALSVVSYIRSKYGVVFSIVGVTKLLHRLGFSYKKPKIVPGKADPISQAAFLETYAGIKSWLGYKRSDVLCRLHSP